MKNITAMHSSVVVCRFLCVHECTVFSDTL